MGQYAFDISDIKISILTADTGTTGPTYATAIDFPAAQLLEIDEDEGDTVELRGDGGVVATSSTPGANTFALRGGGVPVEVIKEIYDMQLVVEGSGSTEVKTLYPKENPSPPFFKIEGISLARDGGDLKTIIYKAKVNPRTLPPISFEEGAFSDVEINGGFFLTDSTTNDAAHNSVATKLKIDVKKRATAGA